jgi:inosose dehydratase
MKQYRIAPAANPPARLSRRDFLHTAGTAALASALAPAVTSAVAAPLPKALVGSQSYGWGQYYQREGLDLNAHLDDVMSALRDAGYDYLETNLDVGTPENNARLAERLRAKGLHPVCLYVGARLHDEKAGDVVERILTAAKVCRKAGFQVINCNADPIGRAKTDAELRTQVAAMKQLGAGLRELGLRFGIHQHTPEMADHAREFHYSFNHSAAGVVDWCFDVHWVYRGGLAPLEALRAYGDRVVSWHLRQSRGGIWWEEFAPGDVDYPAVAAAAQARGCARRYAVELALENGTKITRSAVENHRRSREYVRQVFGV